MQGRCVGILILRVWGRADSCFMLSNQVYAVHACAVARCAWNPFFFSLKGESYMQVVVIRSPKALRGLLKLLFKMKES